MTNETLSDNIVDACSIDSFSVIEADKVKDFIGKIKIDMGIIGQKCGHMPNVLSSLEEVYLYGAGWYYSWTACSWGVNSPHSFSATFNTPYYTPLTGPATLYAAGPGYAYEIVADFMVSNSVPSISSIYPATSSLSRKGASGWSGNSVTNRSHNA